MQFAIIIEDVYPFTSDVKVIRLSVLAMFAPYTHGNGGEATARSLVSGECGSFNEIKWGTSHESHYGSEIIGCRSSREPFRPISQFCAKISRPRVRTPAVNKSGE